MAEGRIGLKGVFNKFTEVKARVYNELETQKSIDNVFGFISADENTESSILIANISTYLASKKYNVCILDNKVFYPNMYKILGCNAPKKGQGLLPLLQTDKVDYSEQIIKTKYNNLFILSSSPQDLFEEYFDIELEAVSRLIEELKQMFDYVLIDIPNNPAFELCVGSIQNINIGFFVWNEHINCAHNMTKFLDYISSIGCSTAKLTNVILNNLYGLPFDQEIIKELGFKLICQFPHRKEILNLALDGKSYILDSMFMDKKYKYNMEILIKFLTERL
ncbi:P-loop NTPase family protein [Defluviitalea phaphyphila]|uniref:ATPase n=1 Tax=Defluviitalea phaphyphila TaxID=1473580 RepID=UPI000731C29E|nr:ATPase [Defluviitalea phaphyphila]